MKLEWTPGEPATEATTPPARFSTDPNAPGGARWAIECARKRVELLAGIIKANREELRQALAELAEAEAAQAGRGVA